MIFRYAIATGRAQRDPSQDLHGALKTRKTVHYPSIPFAELSGFLDAIDQSGATLPDDPIFKRLSYEIAFTEYAVALGYETAERDPDYPAIDILFDVRATVNRIAANAAALYA